MEQPQVSVIIPVGAVDELLEPQLEAVLTQELDRPFEVVMSRNTPDPLAITALDDVVARLANPRLRVVASDDKRSASYARNVGAREAAGQLLVFCDADDEVAPGWLQALVDALADCDAVGGYLEEERFLPPRQRKWRPPSSPDSLPEFYGVPYIVSCNMGISREAFVDVGGFDETLLRSEDIAISISLIHSGRKTGFARDAVVHYRHRPTLRALCRQHFAYGRGMAQLLSRYELPGSECATGENGQSKILVPNRQPPYPWSPVRYIRRASTGLGRLVGLVEERNARRNVKRGVTT
jgi:cellulose synthase/poly-beta-1,6-N-acetylglucosamine synthase-like glycosyltransferase